jgi:hypothetical protein
VHVYYDELGQIEEIRMTRLWERMLVDSLWKTRPGRPLFKRNDDGNYSSFAADGSNTLDKGQIYFSENEAILFVSKAHQNSGPAQLAI